MCGSAGGYAHRQNKTSPCVLLVSCSFDKDIYREMSNADSQLYMECFCDANHGLEKIFAQSG